jgi:hypothetical protein
MVLIAESLPLLIVVIGEITASSKGTNNGSRIASQ